MPSDSTALSLVVTSLTPAAARCRALGTGERLILRAPGLWRVVPGDIVTVRPRRRWSYGRTAYLSGEIIAVRADVAALRLTPLRLEERGVWDPREEYWGEEDEPLPQWALPIVARGPRPAWEMEQILPGDDPDDPDGDPIIASNELKQQGDHEGACRILMQLLEADLRCLDAHAHLGNLTFSRPEDAIRHYEMGVRIAELSLGPAFADVLPWGAIDNRPFLRCLHGYALCLWRLGRTADAASVFERLLWLNPSDNQGARFNLQWLREGRTWEETADWA